jgi:hypothetical protein
MPSAVVEEYVRVDQLHRHDASHRARLVARTLRAPRPLHLPRGFDPAMVETLPEPARRWLLSSIERGALLFGAAEIQMSGEIKLDKWRPFSATEALVPDVGFVWAGHTRVAGLPVRGFDSYALGTGRMSWRVFGVVPVQTATGFDVTRSAADRLAAESVLLPTSLVCAEWGPGPTPDSACYRRRSAHRATGSEVTIDVAPDGRLRKVSMLRWGAPRGHACGHHNFEVLFDGEFMIDGIAIPDRWSAAWLDEDGTRQEFFRASIDTADFLLAGQLP